MSAVDLLRVTIDMDGEEISNPRVVVASGEPSAMVTKTIKCESLMMALLLSADLLNTFVEFCVAKEEARRRAH